MSTNAAVMSADMFLGVFLAAGTLLGWLFGLYLYRRFPADFWFCLILSVGYIALYTYDVVHMHYDWYVINPAYHFRQFLARAMLFAAIWTKHAIFLFYPYHTK